MDFFQAQDEARTRSRRLVVLFVAAVATIIAAVYFLVHALLGPGLGEPIDWQLGAIVAGGVVALVAVGSSMRTLQLRQGGSKVAEMLGGRRVRMDTQDEHERRLVNVVEEMSLAAGTPVPAIYVLDHERGINAFAAGYTLDDAAVAVTRGTLETLNRDELQGVMAHEFSHILHGDMRLNIRLMGLLFGILLLAIIGRGIMYGSGRGGRRGGGKGGGGGGQAALVGIGLIAIGYIGVLFGRLIQAAVSRQREFLADASAVQFTRNPDGIAGALKKIGGLKEGSRIQDHHAAEASHLFFANGLSRAFTSAFATHPPLAARIKRIDASFAGETKEGRPQGKEASLAAGVSGFVSSVGEVPVESIAAAGRLLESLPREVRDAAHDTEDAPALLFALLLHAERPHGEQRDALMAHGGAPLAERTAALRTPVASLGPAARLPLVDLLLPALRELDAAARSAVNTTAERLIRADGRVDMFELAVFNILGRQLAEKRNAAADAKAGTRSLQALRKEAALVLTAVAWSGSQQESEAATAFSVGTAVLRLPGGLSPAPRQALTPGALDAALNRLHTAAPAIRRRFMEACAATAAHDGLIETQEAELLRAVGEALECPVPLGGA